MPVLKNQRRELFAQGIVKGLTKAQAAINAGFSAKSAESAGCRLAKDVKVKARIVELQARIVKVGEAGLTNTELAAQSEPIPFVRASVADRQYRITLLAEMIEELRAVSARATEGGRIAVGVYREARECLKQVAIETGHWEDKHRIADDCGPDLSHLTNEQLLEEQKILREARERLEALRRPKEPGLIEAAPGTVEHVAG